ncbi:MAG: TrmH family RNA methyltransferase [Actinomycetaceae bacterium]
MPDTPDDAAHPGGDPAGRDGSGADPTGTHTPGTDPARTDPAPQGPDPDGTPSDGEVAADREVGVGPWEGEAPDDARLDPELIVEGDRRNVVDRYRYWRVEAIAADMAARAQPLHLALMNTGRDLNIGSLVRTANAFNLASVQIVGRRRWNRRGAMVTDRYLRIGHRSDARELVDWARSEGLAIVGVDNLPGSVPLEGQALPERAVLVLGEESAGLTGELLGQCDLLVSITQYGSTRSLNVAAAGAIAMHAWMVQHAR